MSNNLFDLVTNNYYSCSSNSDSETAWRLLLLMINVICAIADFGQRYKPSSFKGVLRFLLGILSK